MVRMMRDKRSIDRIRKTASGVVVAASVTSAALFLKLLAIADFAEPLHVMVLLATAMVFGTVGFGLVALGAYCRFWIREAVKVRDRRS